MRTFLKLSFVIGGVAAVMTAAWFLPFVPGWEWEIRGPGPIDYTSTNVTLRQIWETWNNDGIGFELGGAGVAVLGMLAAAGCGAGALVARLVLRPGRIAA